MVLVNYSGKEINAKVVYYGPGLCGKTTNLEFIYGRVPQTNRGKMVSMKTRTERTLFFDFLPLNLGELAGFQTRFLLYTVPGQIYYNATRKLVLKGVDALVFVADSARDKMEENLESFDNLKDNLKEHGLSLDDIPLVLQYNKRDLPDVYTVEEMQQALNPRGEYEFFEAVATTGQGVFETFKGVARLLLAHLSKKMGVRQRTTEAREASGVESQPATSHAAQAPTPVQGSTPAPVSGRESSPRDASSHDAPAWAPEASPAYASTDADDENVVEHAAAPTPRPASSTSPEQPPMPKWSQPTGAPGQIEMTAAPAGQAPVRSERSELQVGASAFPSGSSKPSGGSDSRQGSTPAPPSGSHGRSNTPPPQTSSLQRGAPQRMLRPTQPGEAGSRPQPTPSAAPPESPAPMDAAHATETSTPAPHVVPVTPAASGRAEPRVIQLPIQLEPQDLVSGVVLELHVVVRSQEGLLRRAS